jgi:hypothetical protein
VLGLAWCPFNFDFGNRKVGVSELILIASYHVGQVLQSIASAADVEHLLATADS